MRGTMLWFNEEKDHGYISTETGERLYVAGAGFADGHRPRGRCAGSPVEFQVTAYEGAREAGGCVTVEEVAPPRARRRHASRSLR